jgi:hypothetical protein
MSKRRYLLSAYFSDFVEAATEQDAIDAFYDQLNLLKLRDFEVQVQEEDDPL